MLAVKMKLTVVNLEVRLVMRAVEVKTMLVALEVRLMMGLFLIKCG